MPTTEFSEHGFTLVEVLFALALIVLVVVATVDIVSRAVDTVRDARERTTAGHLARQKLDELRALRHQTIAMPESAPGVLDSDHAGAVDYLDASGNRLPTAVVTGEVAFVRRWSVRAHVSSMRLRVIRVLVLGPRVRGRALEWGSTDQVLITSMVGG